MAKALRTKREQLVFVYALTIGLFAGALLSIASEELRYLASAYWEELIIGCITRGDAAVFCG